MWVNGRFILVMVFILLFTAGLILWSNQTQSERLLIIPATQSFKKLPLICAKATHLEEATELPSHERGNFWHNQLGCMGCHSPDGTPLVGPTFLGLYISQIQLNDGTMVIADEAYFRRSILEPDAQIKAGYRAGIMPHNYEEQIDELEREYSAGVGRRFCIIDDLFAYVRTLE